jgi:hypothetical protein
MNSNQRAGGFLGVAAAVIGATIVVGAFLVASSDSPKTSVVVPHVYQCGDAKPQIAALDSADMDAIEANDQSRLDIRWGRSTETRATMQGYIAFLKSREDTAAKIAAIRKEYDDHGCPASDKP